MVPLNYQTMDLTPLKNQILPLASEDGTIEISTLEKESPIWKTLLENDLPVHQLIDWELTGIVDVKDVIMFLALMQYFLAQPRRKGSPVWCFARAPLFLFRAPRSAASLRHFWGICALLHSTGQSLGERRLSQSDRDKSTAVFLFAFVCCV